MFFGGTQHAQRSLFGNSQPSRGGGLFSQQMAPGSGMFAPSQHFDTNSIVWKQCPQEVKQLFDSQKLKDSQLVLLADSFVTFGSERCIKHPFSDKNIGTFDSCTITTVKFIQCYDCQKFQMQGSKKSVFAICEICFDPADHQGHFYEESASRNRNLFNNSLEWVCLCGKDAYLGSSEKKKEEVFRCKHHTKKEGEQKELPFDKKRFMEYFGSLFALIYHQKKENFQNMTDVLNFVYNTLFVFCKDSPQNCRLTAELLTTTIKGIKNQTKPKQSHNIFRQNKSHAITQLELPLIFLVSQLGNKIFPLFESDVESMKILVKAILPHKQAEKNSLKTHLQYMFHHLAVVEVAMKEQAYHMVNTNAIRILSGYSKQNAEYLIRYFKHYQNQNDLKVWTQKALQILDDIRISNILLQLGSYLLPLLLKSFSKLFSDKSPSQSQRNNNREDDDEEHDDDNSNDGERRKSWQDNLLNSMVTVIGRVIFSLAKTDREAVRDCREILPPLMKFSPLPESNQHQSTKLFNKEKETIVKEEEFLPLLEEYIKWLVNNYGQIKGSFNNSLKLLVHLCVLRSPQKKQYIEKLINQWVTKVVCSRQNSFFSRQNIEFNFSTYEQLLTSLRICMLSRIYMTRYEKNQFHDEEYLEKYRKYRRQKLLEYFYQVKVYSPSKLQTSKTFFNVPDYSELVKEYLIYNHESELFFYSEKEKFPNQLMYLFNEDSGNRNSSPKSYFNINCQESFDLELQDEIQRECMEEFFVKSSLFSKIMETIDQALKDTSNDEESKIAYSSNGFGVKVVELIVIINLLAGGKHKEVKQELDKIINDESHRQRYLSLGDKQTLYRVLCIQETKQAQDKPEQKKEISEQDKLNQAFLEKAALKKKEKYQKMKEKRSLAIGMLNKSESLSKVPSQEGDFCIICREKSKKNNQLVYLVQAISNYTLSSGLYEADNKMKTHIESCFHAIHVDCYLSRQKKPGFTRNQACTLCGKTANCILPERYDPKEKKILRVCTNSIISVFFSQYENYDIDNLFILMLRHLVESRSFLSLTNVSRFEESRRKRERIDYFIEDFIRKMYETASSEEKDNYDRSVSDLLEELETCKEEIAKKAQQLILNSIMEKFRTGEVAVNIQVLESLASKMDKKEFMVIKYQVEDLGASLTNEQEAALEKLTEKEEERTKVGKVFPIRPPEYAHQIRKFGKSQCHFCKTPNRESMCLICGFELCNRCEGSKNHQRFHQDKMLSFIYREALLQYQNFDSQGRSNGGLFGGGRGHQNQKANLYFTDLMIPLCNRTSAQQKEVFKLNDAVLSKYTSQF